MNLKLPGKIGKETTPVGVGLNSDFLIGSQRSGWANSPSLFLAIPHILLVRSEEKVSRVDTGRIVALVADIHPCGHGAVKTFPGEAMGQPATAVLAAPAKVSVARPLSRAGE